MPVYFQIELKESPLHGLGIFAVEKIPKGAVIWSWQDRGNSVPALNNDNSRPNQAYTTEELLKIQDEDQLRKTIRTGFPCYSNNTFYCLRDGTQVTNHSYTPNMQYSDIQDVQQSVAVRDIQPGEQICQNYYQYLMIDVKDQQLYKLFQKYDPQRIQFQAILKKELAQKEK